MIIIKHNYHYLHASLSLNFGEIIHNFLRLSDLAPSGQKQRCGTHEGATTETALAAVSYTTILPKEQVYPNNGKW